MSLSEIARALGTGTDVEPGPAVSRVCIDSRVVRAGDLFFCIVGQNLDGHEFALQAVEAGACAVVADRPLSLPVPVLLVRDTTRALGRLARYRREKTTAKVIGVTGSSGKTTVKEMLAGVLSQAGHTGKNFRNLNNQIGLPLSILEMNGDEDFWVLELGINHPGEMDDLGYILAPDAALIVNIGPCHLEGLGSPAGVAREKSILLDYVRPGGFACVSVDYPLLLEACAAHRTQVVKFSGQGGQAAYTCREKKVDDQGISYVLGTPAGEISLRLPAQVNVPENVTAVTAMCLELGLDPAVIESGLSGYEPAPQRFVVNQVGSWTFIDDTYNANPMSMACSLAEAVRLAAGRPLVLVLGEMRELGADAAREHRKLGERIAATAAVYCFFFGENAKHVREGLDGFSGDFIPVTTPEDFLGHMQPLRFEEGLAFFKGSRGCKMENFYAALERSWA
jgi:UDP-N-acetylmuramoyl-tripeptide--D-alanyl-D-alanine ligase